MIFSSIPFLYYFLPCVLALYYFVPKKLKNGVLLLSSLVFYAWGEPKAVLVMVIAISSSYICGLLIERFRNQILSKVFLVVGAGIALAFLAYFKYAGFFLENFAAVTGIPVGTLKIVLPVGISFYTFQLVSYLADVYRETVSAQKNLINLGTYVAMFPQLIAGPIVRYKEIEQQLKNRRHSYEKMAQGIRRFVLGMGKKVLISDALGELCSHFQESSDLSVLYVWMYAVAFMLQIYFDFSGYSDMAIGLGKMFGFELMENFNYPYISRSITEFWRRWHISLGSWFRDYVYIPMGGNRVSKSRWLFNIFVVWMLTGFWHGAAWNFILWGLYFAVLLLVEKLWLQSFLEKHKVFAHIYVLFAVMIGFVLFNAESVGAGFAQIGALFGVGGATQVSSLGWPADLSGLPLISAESLYYLRSYGVIFMLAIVGATPVVKRVVVSMEKKFLNRIRFIWNCMEVILMIGLLLLMTAYFVDGSFSPFLYFRF